MPEPAPSPAPPPPARARITPIRPGVDDVVEREALTLSSPPTPTSHARLSPHAYAEQRLAAWMHEHLRTAGAAAMIRRYGIRTVLTNLYDGVIVRTQEPYFDEQAYIDTPGSSPRDHTRFRSVARPRPTLRNPGGFLHSLLKG